MKVTNDKPLQKPTVDLVLEEEKFFDKENAATENALTWLFRQFPRNTEKFQVLLKVTAINQLYSTNIYAVRLVANQIADLDIDSKLDTGSIKLVDDISRVRVGADKQRYNLSFACKYCSWHRPESYAIYDSRARECLWAYKRQFDLSFTINDLWEYSSFFKAIKDFQDRFDLRRLSFKQIDKLLYRKGGDLLDARKQIKNAANEAGVSENPSASRMS